MRTPRESLSQFHFHPQIDDQCSATVIYEDTDARERALSLCHHLVRGFWAEIDFAFSWWRFRYLVDADIAQAAAQAAAQADILLFSASTRDHLPEEVRNWTELWIPQRRPGDGVLLVLTEDIGDAELADSPVFSFLQNVARRASMDCLPRLSDEPWPAPPEGVRNMQNRAAQGTRILDEILRQSNSPPLPPLHWGINE